LETGLKLDFK